MSNGQNNRALDRDEAEMVEQTHALAALSDAQLTDLVRRLRERRDRAQRQIRTRVRKAQSQGGAAGADSGAREKKALLAGAVQRVAEERQRRRKGDGAEAARTATQHLREAVKRKAETPSWTGPEDLTANSGPAETPNTKIAPSGALHAEGMRAAIARSTGDR
jgi:activator of 2-hydroxyglutaryl-CoA dehydratase